MKQVMFRRRFEPMSIGDLVVMLDQGHAFRDGAYLWEVSGVEAVPAMPHNAVVLLTAAASGAAVLAGYNADTNCKFGVTVASGAESPRVTPVTCQLDQYQLGQFRFRPIVVNPDAPPALQDLGVRAYSGSTPRWTSSNVQGELNAQMQTPDPIDPFTAPARGANTAAPATYPGDTEWDRAYSSELWTYYQRISPGFSIVNRGSATLGANATFTFFMRIMGWIYTLTAFPLDNPHTEQIAGTQLALPGGITRHDIAAVQLNYRPPKAAPN